MQSAVIIGGYAENNFGEKFSLEGRSADTVRQKESALELASEVDGFVDSDAGEVVAKFVHPIDDGPFANQPVKFIWAFNENGDLREQRHDEKGIKEIDFLSSSVGDTLTSEEQKYVAHGAIMFVAWGVLVPIGVFFARYGKRIKGWFWVHVSANSLAVTFVIAGAAIAFAKFESEDEFVHQQVGITLLAASVVHILSGVVKPSWQTHYKARMAWGVAHRFVGRAILLMSVWNIYTGLQLIQAFVGNTQTLQVLFWCWVALLVLVAWTIEEHIGERASASTGVDASDEAREFNGKPLGRNNV